MDDLEDYFWRKPTEIHNFHKFRVLGYVTLTCYAIGVLTFIPGMAVLTRKHMISPMNTILGHYFTNLIIAGFLYIPHTYHELFRAKLCAIPEHNTYTWEMISWLSLMTAAAFRNFAVWMAEMISIWRYVAVIHPLKERRYCTMEITKKVILFGYVLVLFTVAMPLFFLTGVGPAIKLLDQNGCSTANFSTGKNVTIYEFQLFTEDYPVWYSLGMCSFGISVKLWPSTLMTFVSVRLIKAIIDARRRRKQMVIISGRENTDNSKTERQISRNKDRTTIMLSVLLGLFAIAEVPLGIFCVLSGIYGPKFFWKYYYHTIEVVNALIYCTEAFNFPVYYIMSRTVRETVKSICMNNSVIKKIAKLRTAGSSLPGMSAKDSSTRSSSNAIISPN